MTKQEFDKEIADAQALAEQSKTLADAAVEKAKTSRENADKLAARIAVLAHDPGKVESAAPTERGLVALLMGVDEDGNPQRTSYSLKGCAVEAGQEIARGDLIGWV